jgi:hypothetical protein
MINDATTLIFEFAVGEPQEIDGVALGTLLSALESLIEQGGRPFGLQSANFMHVAPPRAGSLRFSFKVKIEGEIRLPKQSSPSGRNLLGQAADAAGIAALLVAIFAPNGVFELFHNGSSAPSSGDTLPLLGEVGGAMLGSADAGKLFLAVRQASDAIDASCVSIQVPDCAPIHLSSPESVVKEVHPAEGAWLLTLNTPMGLQEVRTVLSIEGEKLTGRSEGQMGAQEFSGYVEGGALQWSSKISSPMPMTLEFNLHIVDDRLVGSVSLGAAGSAPVTGVRLLS